MYALETTAFYSSSVSLPLLTEIVGSFPPIWFFCPTCIDLYTVMILINATNLMDTSTLSRNNFGKNRCGQK